MKEAGFFLFIIFTSISSCLAKNSYLVMFPNTIRRGLNMNVLVQLLDTTGSPGTTMDATSGGLETTVVVSLLDHDNNTVVSERRIIDSVNATLQSIPLKIPLSLSPPGVTEYAIEVHGEGGVNFSNQTKVSLRRKTHSVMIQTDKAIYKPGQNIHFRIFGFYPDLSIVNENIDVAIFDPHGYKIAQWKNKVPDNGVFTDSLVMSDHPVLGEWKIKAVQGPRCDDTLAGVYLCTPNTETQTKTVTVDEYVLPRFNVTLELPPYGVSNRIVTSIKVISTYTFGKPVKGMVDIRIRSKQNLFSSVHMQLRQCQGHMVEIFHRAPIDGQYTFDVENTKLKSMVENSGFQSLLYASLVFEVNVTESITGLSQSASGTVTFYETENKLQFLESLPSTFKSGLNFTVLGKLTRQDEKAVSLPTTSRVKLTVTQTITLPSVRSNSTMTSQSDLSSVNTTIINMISEDTAEQQEIETEFGILLEDLIQNSQMSNTEERTIKPVFLDIDANGFFKHEITIPEGTKSISIKAEYNGLSSSLYLRPSKSPSNSFMQVRLLHIDRKPKVGSISAFEIRTTESTSKIYYQIISKGRIVESGDLNMQSSKVKRFNLTIIKEMVPKARLIVHYVRKDGEIVADAISFNIDGSYDNKIEIDFDVQETRPGNEVVVSFKADPDSTVHLLAVDKSVLILRDDNDVKESMVSKELNSFDEYCHGDEGDEFCHFRLPSFTGSEYTHELFKEKGLAVLTDALIHKDAHPIKIEAMWSGGGFRTLYGSITETNQSTESTEKRADGMTSFSVPVPDTITTWVATAFAVNPNSGLGLDPSPANLRVFQPFFVSLTLPYSVIRGELVVLQANVFNYLKKDIKVLIIIDKNKAFKNVVTYLKDNQVKSGRFSFRIGRTLNIAPGEIYPVYFPIVPSEIGDIKINITATSTGASDSIIRTLKVEPEGVEKEFNNPVLINTEDSGTFFDDVEISFPPNTVAGSKRVRASVIGDVMGPSISGLASLLKMPYGCGEQNMLNFAPNIFVWKYLTITNNLTPDLERKAKEYMIKGYQRQMTYVHQDGSYSAFGKSDASGSTWLTAFVVKSFSQASDLITIDKYVVNYAVSWLISQQNKNGTFREPGRVINKAMQGGSAAGERTLTAFSLIALKEAENMQGSKGEETSLFDERRIRILYFEDQERYRARRAIKKARTYLEGEIDLLEDVYELALVGYALLISNSSRVNEVINKLNEKATVKDELKYWSKPETGIQWKEWAPPKDQAKAVDIETTAYALLSLAINKDLEGGLPVLKWIISQRNPEGGFASTQDTIVALQALSEFATMVYSPNLNMRVRLVSKTAGAPFQHEFKVTRENALILQTTDIPQEVKSIGVMAEGTGIAIAEISTYFNINEDIEDSSFDVNVTLIDETTKGFTVKICGRWLKEGQSGMSMMDIGIPSGMTPDLDTLDTSNAPMYKQNEMGYRKLSLYFDEFDKQAQCASVYMANTDKVAEKQPSVIRLYDYYYEPKNQATIFYTSSVLANSGVCDVCGRECFCADSS